MLPLLKDINVSKMESSRLQKIAAIPDKCNNLLSLQDAYKQKEFVGHGNFVKWIENNLDIDDNTVYRYIKLYSYADKIPILGNLQDAYKQIETIEAQAKLTLEMLTGICFDEHTEINNVNVFR